MRLVDTKTGKTIAKAVRIKGGYVARYTSGTMSGVEPCKAKSKRAALKACRRRMAGKPACGVHREIMERLKIKEEV